MRAIASTVSTGYFPLAVSAESITASVPSRTAFATSETSARVGTGAMIIDSIICVAVIVSLLRSRAVRIMRFCNAGTAASPTSTARSPRATMMPSLASMISPMAMIASARSILAISIERPPAARINSLAMYMSAPLLGKDTARKSAFIATDVLMSSMSLAVSAGAVNPPPWRLMPLLFDRTPPTRTVVVIWLPWTFCTSSTTRPSSSSSTEPGETSRGNSL